MPPPIITEGTGYVLFAYDVAHAFDLAAAETRLASATQRQTVKQKRRAPAFFEYDPAPLRVTEPADSLAVGEHVTAPYVEFVLYDFGAVSVSYAIPLQGPLTGLPALSTILYGNEQLQADSRRRVQQLIEALGDAAIRSRLADFVEDYVVFQIEAFTELLEMRYLDAQLDEALERAYDLLGRSPGLRRFLPSPYGVPLQRLGRLQLDAAVLFEQVTNALKLIGEQYLTRVYGHVSRRFHLAEWDVSITRKLQTLDGIYGKLADRAGTQRMELLEWIIIVLIAVSIVLPFFTGLVAK